LALAKSRLASLVALRIDPATAHLKDLQAKGVTHFLSFSDRGGLSYAEMETSLCLFAERVMPHFKS
jgi:hypothetical protein